MKDFLREKLSEENIEITEFQVEQFITFMNLLKEENKKTNLTAITEDKEIVIKHFVDSISVCKYFSPKDERLVDIGSGAGFPAIPLKIIFPELDVTMIDSVGKKVIFQEKVIAELGLKNCRGIHGRLEDLARGTLRETFDVCTARAVASMNVLIEYAAPFLKVNGKFIAMKGRSIEEHSQWERALKELKCALVKEEKEMLSGTDIERNIYIIEKKGKTDGKYPRKAGTPKRQPIS